MKKGIKVNPSLLGLIEELKEASRTNKAPIWRDVAVRLEKPRRNWPSVNIGKIGVVLKENEVALIPGKVLGDGELDRKIEVAAFSFSTTARDKIASSGGKALSIEELVSKNPKGTGVRIIK
jgi:large subunit ribosomal protein L18e